LTSFFRSYVFEFQAEDGSSVKIEQSRGNIGLKMDFNISKSQSSGNNLATISIWNLSKDTIGILQKKGIVRLQLGYEGDIANILVGSVVSLNFEDEGGDKKTDIQVQEGFAGSFAETKFSKQYGIGTTNQQIILDIVNYLVANNPSVDSFDFFTIDSLIFYNSEQVVTGNAFKKLAEFLAPAGYKYFINKGILQIVALNGFVRDTEVPVTPDTGLIGYVRPIADSTSMAKSLPGIQFKHILNYNFDVGRRIRVTSADYNNNVFIIDSVTFTGSTFDGEYVCEVRAVESD